MGFVQRQSRLQACNKTDLVQETQLQCATSGWFEFRPRQKEYLATRTSARTGNLRLYSRQRIGCIHDLHSAEPARFSRIKHGGKHGAFPLGFQGYDLFQILAGGNRHGHCPDRGPQEYPDRQKIVEFRFIYRRLRRNLQWLSFLPVQRIVLAATKKESENSPRLLAIAKRKN